MQIDIVGGTSRQKELIKDMLEYSGKHLLSSRMYNRISIYVTINKIKDKNGDCCFSDDNRRPREFSISLNRELRQRDLLETVAHEMVHIKQWATSQLIDYISDTNKVKYDGKIYYKDRIEYWDYPWEIEAYGREVGIFIRWAKKRGEWGKNWTMR